MFTVCTKYHCILKNSVGKSVFLFWEGSVKRSLFTIFSILFCALIMAATISAQPIKVEKKVKPLAPPVTPQPLPPDIPVKKLMADLVVTNVSITPPTPRQGIDMVQIEVTVKNAGNKTLPRVCSLSMDLWNQDTHPDYHHKIIPWYTGNIPQLAPGAEVRISHTITIPYVGNYKLDGVIITEGLQVGDEKPQNNQYIKYFQVIPKPAPADLVLESLMPTNDGRIKMKMYNKGSAIPDIDFNACRVTVEVNDTFYRNVKLSDIDPTGVLKNREGTPRAKLEYIWPSDEPNGYMLRPGNTYKVRVTLDSNTTIIDSDWSNNAMTVVWHMTP